MIAIKLNRLTKTALIIMLASVSFLGGVFFTKVDGLKTFGGTAQKGVVVDKEKVLPEKTPQKTSCRALFRLWSTDFQSID